MSEHVRPWYACTGDPCTCPKPEPAAAENTRRLAWFTDDELRAELARRVDTHPTPER
jgi:hypothetical protein